MDNYEQLIAGFERIGTLIRKLLWENSFNVGLNPIQLQILFFCKQQNKRKVYPTKLSEFFGVSLPSLSDSLNSLIKKGLIKKTKDKSDKRISYISLTRKGQKLLKELSNWDASLKSVLNKIDNEEIKNSYYFLLTFLRELLNIGIMQHLRMCFTCQYLSINENGEPEYFCNFLKSTLKKEQLRIDCPDHLRKE